MRPGLVRFLEVIFYFVFFSRNPTNMFKTWKFQNLPPPNLGRVLKKSCHFLWCNMLVGKFFSYFFYFTFLLGKMKKIFLKMFEKYDKKKCSRNTILKEKNKKMRYLGGKTKMIFVEIFPPRMSKNAHPWWGKTVILSAQHWWEKCYKNCLPPKSWRWEFRFQNSLTE